MADRKGGNSFKIEKNVKPEELYTLKEELGKGKFGVVYRCEEKATGTIWAAKYVKTIRAKDREDVLREITLMSELEHPSLMALVAAFQTTRQTVLILECITGGELFERIVDDKFDLTESEVISYMRQICAGVQHMHHHHILHLDLKPENIMCVNRTGFQLKIIDFGLARKYEPGGEIKVLCGTPEFVAPEVVSYEAIAHPTDMWSVGVICYILLSGLSPFMGDNDNDTLNNVTVGDWDFDDEVFDNISCQAKDFISSLLIKDMSKRMTVDECFRHPWLSEISTRTKACENKLSTERHKKFLARRRWQKTANAVRAIGRMNALRLVSQRKANKSSGSSSSEKSPTSPSPTPSPKETRPKSPEPKPTGGGPAENGKRKPAPEAETKKEKAKIDTNIDQGTDATNAASCVSPPPLNNRDSSSLPTESNGREFSCTLDSDIENDSGLDLSLDHNALGKRSTSVSERSSQDSVVAGKDDLLIDEEVRTPDEGPNGDATRVDQLLSREKGAEPILDAQPAACVHNGKSDSGVCSDASEDTVSSDPGVNMERYLFDPSKGVKNQAAKWEVRTQSPDRAAKLKSKAAQPPPQQAPVFRQKFRHCEVALGSEARFECRVDGHPSPDIIWYKNGKRVMEGERYSIKRGVEDIHCLVVKEVARDDQGTFMCEARSPAGKARCSARLVIQHPSLSRDDIKSPPPESKEPKTNGTSRKFWHFGSSKNKDQRDKSATPVKSPTSPPATTSSKQSLFGLSFDRKTSFRGATDDRSPASPAASPGQTTAQKSAVDKLKERAEAFTQEYEKRKGERQSLADREPRRASISLYLERYSRSASADRSSSFSVSSSSGRRSSTASSTDESDFEPRPRPRLATYATMIRSTQSIGSLAAKFEQNKANGSQAKSVTSPSPRKDLKYNANLDAKKALFSNAANGSTAASSTKSKAKDPVPLISRSSVLQTPSTSSLRSKFESPSKEKEPAAAPFTRSTQVRQSTGKFSYLDKIESKEKEVSPSTSSFSRASPVRHSTIGVTKSPSIDVKSSLTKTTSVDSPRSVTSSLRNNDSKETSKPVSSVTPTTSASKTSSSSSQQPTFISRYETVINSDSESSVASSSSSSFSDRKSSRTSPSISSRYDVRSPREKPPAFIKKPMKLTSTEGESARFSCEMEGEPKPEVTWLYRGKPLSDEGRHEIYEEKGTHFLEIFNVAPRDAGLYTCRIVNSAGRSSALVELIVTSKPKRPPFFLQKLSDCEVHEAGANGRLQCKLDGEPAPEVAWLKEGKALQESHRVHFVRNANGIHALIIDDVTEDDDAIYTCVAKNKHGQVSSSAELIVEIDPPTKSADENTVFNNNPLHINESDIDPSSSISSAAPVTPEPVHTAPQFVTRPKSVTVDETKSARFSCAVSGIPQPVVTWARDDQVLKDEGRFEIFEDRGEFVMEIFDVVPGDSGMYTCTASNAAGKVATGAQLTVQAVKKAEKPPVAPYTNSMSSTDVRTEDVFSSEDVASIRSEQIPEPTPAKTMEFEPPSRIPPEFLARPSSQTLVEPNSAKFVCRVVGDPKPSVTWSRNGVVLSDAGRFEIYEEGDDFVLEIFDTTPQDTGSYVCTATNLAGQKVAEATLTVESSAPKGSAPEFLEKISDVTVKDGDSVKFVCKLAGIPPPTVHWFYRNQEIVGSDEVYELFHDGETASLCLPEVLPEDEGEYSCKLRNANGEASCTANLKVHAAPAVVNNATEVDKASTATKPEFVQKLKDIQAIDGNPLSLPVRVKGSPDPEVRWFFNNEAIKEDDDFKFVRDGDRYSLVIAEVYPDDAGVYTCKISNAAGADECSAKVFVQENDFDGCPPKFLQKPRSINIDEGSSVTLSCKIDGEPLPTITWIKDGRPIEPGRRFKMESSGISGTTRSLNIPTVLSTDAGSYTCVLQNEFGTEQCSVSVVVKPLEEEQTDFRSLLKSRPRLQNISNSPNNISSDRSEVDQVDFRHVLTRHVQTKKRPVFTRPLTDLEVMEGEPACFECHVDATPPPIITWTLNKKEIKESKYFQMSYTDNVAKLLIAEAFPEDEGDYTCTATNEVGQVSCSADLTVQDDESNLSVEKAVCEEEAVIRAPSSDGTRSVIEHDSTKDKVASTFNVRLSKVINGTEPSTAVQHNTNTNNNKAVVSAPVELSPPVVSPEKPALVEEPVTKSERAAVNAVMDHAAQNGDRSPPASEPPAFLEGGLRDVTVLEDNSAMLKCQVVGEPEPDIHWYRNDVELKNDRKYKLSFPDDDVAVLIVKLATLEDAGTYTCKAVNSCGAAESSAKIIVEAPASIKDAPRSVQAMAGKDLTITCNFVAIPEPDVVVWSKNRKTIKEDDRIEVDETETSTTLIVGKATHADAGRYTLLVENELGSDEATINVSVLDKPDPPVGKPIASHVTRESLTLSWTGSSYDGGSRITGYVIEMRTAGDGPEGWRRMATVSNTSHCLEDLKPETKYLFRISSENEFGISDAGQESDEILTVVKEQKSKAEPAKSESDSDQDAEHVEFRHVTIKPDKEFSEKYAIKEILGKGRFGTVHKCVDKVTGKEYAAKMIKTIKASEKEAVRNEIEVMNKLHHAKLLQCLDAFESPKQMIMVLEIVNGGELFERVIDDDFCLTECDVIKFMRQICNGVRHMHQQNILHLDLKPENILCVDKTGSRIKLIDFGLARAFNPRESTKVMFGTPEFVAPEVINYDAIGFTTDMWSVGVICYILLSGLSPFMGDNDAETLNNVTLAEWDFEDEAFDAISEDAKSFIDGLLIQKKEERMTADGCLEHKWLRNDSSDLKSNKISTAKLKNFVARRRWQSGSNELDSSSSDVEESTDDKTATAVRAIGRMASLSLFGSAKKSADTKAQSPALPSPKEKVESEAALPTPPKSDTQAKTESSAAPSTAKTENTKLESDLIVREDSVKLNTQPKVEDVKLNDSRSANDNKKVSEEAASDGADDEGDEVDGLRKDLNQNIPGAPHFTKEMVDCEVFEGDSARFDCCVAGDPEPDIKWFQDGVEIEESARFIFDYDDGGLCSLIIRRIQEDDEGEYSITATNSKGEATCVADLLVDGF